MPQRPIDRLGDDRTDERSSGRRRPRSGRSRRDRAPARRSRTGSRSPRTRPTGVRGHRREARRRGGSGPRATIAGCPSRSRSRTGSRSEAGAGRRFRSAGSPSSSTADTTNVIASRKIAIGAVSTEIRKPLMPKPANSLADQLAASARVRLARGARARRRSAGRRCRPRRRTWSGSRPRTVTRNTWASVSHAGRRTRSGSWRAGPPGRGPPRSGSGAAAAGRPRHRRRARTMQPGPISRPRTSGDLERPGAEDEDRDERQRHPGDERAEDRDVEADHTRTNARFCQSGRIERVAHGRTAYPADRVANGPALHSACLGASELAHPRVGRGADPAHPLTELRTRPCSTPSASDCARRSTA